MSEGPYFQFPLCAIGFSPLKTDCLNYIISYCVRDVGSKQWSALSAMEKTRYRANMRTEKSPKDLDLRREDHAEIAFGAMTLNVQIGTVANIQKESALLREYIKRAQDKHGPDPQVRIRAGLLWETRDGGGLSYRRFALLCAFYSAIGANSNPVRITRDALIPRQLGFKSQKVYAAELLDRPGEIPPPLTERQLRDDTEFLCRTSLLFRFNPTRRTAYYSNRMTVQEMVEWFKNKMPKYPRFIAGERRKRNEFYKFLEGEWQNASAPKPAL